jgi:DNA invertase Pin-like site-specific DNA recombinase
MQDATPLHAAILGRVSRDRSREARSVVQQQDDNRAECAVQGWFIPPGGEYQDVGSAARFATRIREDWERLLHDLDAHLYGVVVMWEPSRGSRKLSEWALFLDTCRDNRVLIHITDHRHTYDLGNPRDWRSLAEDGVDSAYESEKTQRRVLRDQKAAAAAGRPHGLVQYGYQRTYDKRTGRLTGQEPKYPEAAHAAEIIRRIAAREPLSAIRNDLNARGVPAPAGGLWTPATMRRITRCPVYIGKRPAGGKRFSNGRYVGAELIPAIWPAIIEEDVWYDAQQVLDDPSRIKTRPGRQRWLLSYYATCATCGSPLSVHYARRKTGPRTAALYECTGTRHCVHVIVAAADQQVTGMVVRYMSRPSSYAAINTGGGIKAAEARAEAAKLRAQLDEWAAADITARAYKIKEAQLLPKIHAAEQRAQLLTVPRPLRDLTTPGADVRARWEAMPVAARREVLKALSITVEVIPAAGEGGRYLRAGDRVLVRMEKKDEA